MRITVKNIFIEGGGQVVSRVKWNADFFMTLKTHWSFISSKLFISQSCSRITVCS